MKTKIETVKDLKDYLNQYPDYYKVVGVINEKIKFIEIEEVHLISNDGFVKTKSDLQLLHIILRGDACIRLKDMEAGMVELIVEKIGEIE